MMPALSVPQSVSFAKSTAQRIFYGAMDIMRDKTQDDPLKAFKRAVGTLLKGGRVTIDDGGRVRLVGKTTG